MEHKTENIVLCKDCRRVTGGYSSPDCLVPVTYPKRRDDPLTGKPLMEWVDCREQNEDFKCEHFVQRTYWWDRLMKKLRGTRQ